MECNKDEAIKAKEISEAKLLEKDIVGAKKFAQKAEKLFPGLEGLPQLLRTLDVYVSSEKKIDGEPDWYSILGVEPTADDETIRKNYRKLVLSLHPDKNKSVGAEGAFKLVSEAWTLLSDKFKRSAYDQKRNPRPVFQKVTTQDAPSPAGSNGCHQKSSSCTTQPTQPFPPPPSANTFWTSCPKCLTHFEYLNVYLNKRILCPNCREPFWALELSLPRKNQSAAMWCARRLQSHKANHHVNASQDPSLSSSTVKNSPNLKRSHEEQIGATKFQTLNVGLGSGKSDGVVKRRRIAEQSSLVEKVHPGSERVNVSSHSRLNNSRRELSQMEIRSMLMAKARKVILKKLDEWSAEKALRKAKEDRKRNGEKFSSVKKDAVEIKGKSTVKDKDVQLTSQNTTTTNSMEPDVKDAEVMLMSVPDPDFHDFDSDRTENSFGENEIWAAYDDDDGMPRYYAMVHSVISKRPFKMRISWLNSKSNAELSPIDWVASGFPKTSGDFRIGKHEVNTSINSFSHKVWWAKGKKGVIQIFPRKGDVWALYSNWSPDWNEFTPDDLVHKYDMVVVVEEYNEEKGVMVAPLVKVVGFKSVFLQYSDAAEAWAIPKEEIFRFSHQVPFYMLTGEESHSVPKGCLELDPAALPLELLQTAVEAVEIRKGSKASKRTEVKEIITYARKKAKNAKIIGKETDSRDKVKEETQVWSGIER